MTPQDWLKSEMTRTGYGIKPLARASGLSECGVRKIYHGRTPHESTVAILKAFFVGVPSAPFRDDEWLRRELIDTGLSASQLRNHTGTSRDVMKRILAGGPIHPNVYDRLAEWVRAGKPMAAQVKYVRGNRNAKDTPCGEAFVLKMLGNDYITSSTPATTKVYPMAHRMMDGKYVQA